jgi:4-diphosphocytidyl-2-C-methyl-D-erythritol kinase
MTEHAPAKINLCLHVVGQRDDGYHLLDSLVVFADVGDLISVAPSDTLSLTITGPQAANLATTNDNLVLRAARALSPTLGAAITLEKHLPIASGIGGGSADAAATLRALSALWGVPMPSAEAILALGADVPVCLSGKPLRMQGVGENLTPLPPLPNVYIVLANPGVAVATPAVFKALPNKTNDPLPAIPRFTSSQDFAAWLAKQRNDLEAPALALVPIIGQVKTALGSQPGCLLARMSGSGATCFGLFADQITANLARQSIQTAHPDWWVTASAIRS